MDDRIFEVERKPGEIVLRVKTAALPMVSESVRSHFWATWREGLLTLRSLIDVAVEQAEKAEEAKGKGPQKVNVE